MSLESFIKLNDMHNDTLEIKIEDGRAYIILDDGQFIEIKKEIEE